MNKILELTPEEYTQCVEFNQNHGGYSYIIITEEDGQRKFHKRINEPCYGGLRKYKSVHNEEATDDHDKPGDLHKHFPKGEPVGLSIAWGICHSYDPRTYKSIKGPYPPEFERLVKFAFSNSSPMVKGFLDENVIEFTHKDGNINGGLIKATDGDPTTLVNLFRIIHRHLPRNSLQSQLVNKLFESGVTEYEMFSYLMYFNCPQTIDIKSQFMDQYVLSGTKFNLEKHRTGDVNLFTKGSFRERHDYSRKYVQDLFLAPEGMPSFNLGQKLPQIYNTLLTKSNNKEPVEVFAQTLKELFNAAA
jgi:hypothetical protein